MTAIAFFSCRPTTALQVSIAPPVESNADWKVNLLKYIESNCLSRWTNVSSVISSPKSDDSKNVKQSQRRKLTFGTFNEIVMLLIVY